MGIVLSKQQNFSELTVEETGSDPRWLQFIKSWILSKSDLHQQWENFKNTPGGRHVPYRIWLRHGAYLEHNQEGTEIDRKTVA